MKHQCLYKIIWPVPNHEISPVKLHIFHYIMENVKFSQDLMENVKFSQDLMENVKFSQDLMEN